MEPIRKGRTLEKAQGCAAGGWELRHEPLVLEPLE